MSLLAERDDHGDDNTPLSHVVHVHVPAHAQRGDRVTVVAPDGSELVVAVPDHAKPGDTFTVVIPGSHGNDAAHGAMATGSASRAVVVPVGYEWGPSCGDLNAGGFCNSACCAWLGKFAGVFVLVMVVSYLLSEFVTPVILAVAATAPSALILEAMRRLYANHVIRLQMIVTFFECVAWLGALFVLLILLSLSKAYPFFIAERYQTGDCSRCVGGYFFSAFVMAGVLEEICKSLALLRIERAKHVCNARALWVYGVCTGAGFATVENVMYVFGSEVESSGGGEVALLRAISSVPFHCCTGLLMGLILSRRRFLRQEWIRYPLVVLPGILCHGLFDWFLMAGSGFGGDAQWLSVGTPVVWVLFIVAIRWEVLRVSALLPLTGEESENVHTLIANQSIDRPCECCCVYVPWCY